MRQLEMLDESCRLHILRMRHHELFILARRDNLFAQCARAKAAVDQRHRHGLALALSEGQTVAAGKTRRFRRRALELIDHLAFSQRDRTKRHREAGIFGKKFNFDLAEADFASEGMVAAVAALRGIAKRQQKTLIRSREVLQSQITICGKAERLAREV